jgi:hypothetical protein
MNEIFKKAFNDLSIICNQTILHPNDEDQIKVTLSVLHKKNIEIDLSKLNSWLSENGWEEKAVRNIISWATAIYSGSKVHLNNKATAPTENEVWERLTG